VRHLDYGLVIGMFFHAWFLGVIYVAKLSDAIGRKNALLICLSGALAVTCSPSRHCFSAATRGKPSWQGKNIGPLVLERRRAHSVRAARSASPRLSCTFSTGGRSFELSEHCFHARDVFRIKPGPAASRLLGLTQRVTHGRNIDVTDSRPRGVGQEHVMPSIGIVRHERDSEPIVGNRFSVLAPLSVDIADPVDSAGELTRGFPFELVIVFYLPECRESPLEILIGLRAVARCREGLCVRLITTESERRTRWC
jgi:hypothetical protein